MRVVFRPVGVKVFCCMAWNIRLAGFRVRCMWGGVSEVLGFLLFCFFELFRGLGTMSSELRVAGECKNSYDRTPQSFVFFAWKP